MLNGIKKGEQREADPRKEVRQIQLTPVGRAICQEAGPAERLSCQAERLAYTGAGDPEVKERLHKLKLVKALREGKRSWGEVQELIGISRATYYRWERAWRVSGLPYARSEEAAQVR